MAKKKSGQIAALAVLAVVIGVIYKPYLFPSNPAPAVPSPAPGSGSAPGSSAPSTSPSPPDAASSQPSGSVPHSYLALKSAFVEVTRDPFEESSELAGSESDSRPLSASLTGVVVTEMGRVAIINGNAVREGETIAEYTVTKIDPTGIELTNPKTHETVRLSLKP